MNHVIALEAGQSSQWPLEPITQDHIMNCCVNDINLEISVYDHHHHSEITCGFRCVKELIVFRLRALLARFI